MITINNKEYAWKFKFSAQKRLEEISGLNAVEIAELIKSIKEKGIPFGFALNVAYCGLKGGNKDLTVEQVEEILDNGTADDIIEIMRKYNEDMSQYLGVAESPNLTSQAPLNN